MSTPFFKVVDCKFVDINTTEELYPIDNKSVLGLANSFENGKWSYKKFHRFLWNNISQTALTKKERDKLFDEPATLLEKSAQKLRLTSDGGEIGEILLYAIMRNYYNAISAVPKLFYKQNDNDPAKGADTVHIVIESEDAFSLWFGEAKFYNSIEDARLYEITQSVFNSLESIQINKENSIITNIDEIENSNEISESLKQKIIEILDDDTSIDVIKPILHIPILLLYECEITAAATHYDQSYVNEITEYFKERANSYFKKQINKCKNIDLYSAIHFHLIIFPVPNKAKIVSDFTEKANAYRS